MTTPLFSAHKNQEYCPQCGEPLQIRYGKLGRFLGCSAYPNCDYLKPLQKMAHKVLKTLPTLCPQCQHPLQLKQGNFGMFIACSNYPTCHYVATTEDKQAENIPCPQCQKGQLVQRLGRSGKHFYGCNQFPNCKFIASTQPLKQVCPHCDYSYAVIKKTTKVVQIFQCLNPNCQQIFSIKNEN